MKEVRAIITDAELMDINPHMPIAIAVRCKLNECGFRFKDDHLVSSAANETPEPIGEWEYWYDPNTAKHHYIQRYEDEK